MESTSHRKTNAGAIQSSQKTPDRERRTVRVQRRAAWRSQTRLTATAGPSVNARVPKLMAVLLASCRATGPGDASVGTNIASIRSDHGVRPPLLAATGTSQTSTQTGTTATATRRRPRLGSDVHTAHIQRGARKTVTSSRNPLAMPRSSADGSTSQRCPDTMQLASQANGHRQTGQQRPRHAHRAVAPEHWLGHEYQGREETPARTEHAPGQGIRTKDGAD